MQATLHGGLSGKARLNRHRNRVHRMHAQQMLEEYYDDEAGEAPERPIPLRGRAEFLPTIDRWTQEDAAIEDTALESGSQLELKLSVEEKVESAEPQCEAAVAEEGPLSEGVDQQAEAQLPIRSPVKIIPSPYWARPRASFQPQGGRKLDRPFDLRRFGYGCALGSAAAAAILFVVSVMIH